MNQTKRKWCRVALAVVAATMMSAPTFAQNQINLVVPYAPGGITDILARSNRSSSNTSQAPAPQLEQPTLPRLRPTAARFS